MSRPHCYSCGRWDGTHSTGCTGTYIGVMLGCSAHETYQARCPMCATHTDNASRNRAIELVHEFHGGAAGSFRSEGCMLCPEEELGEYQKLPRTEIGQSLADGEQDGLTEIIVAIEEEAAWLDSSRLAAALEQAYSADPAFSDALDNGDWAAMAERIAAHYAEAS